MTRPGDRQLLVLAHQVQQHEHLIAEAVVAVGRDEQAAVLHERHVGEIQRALVLDGERQQTRLVPTCCVKSILSSAQCFSGPRRDARNRLSSASPRLIGASSEDLSSRTPSSSSKSCRIFKICPAPLASARQRRTSVKEAPVPACAANAFREPVLKAREPQRQLRARPALGRGHRIAAAGGDLLERRGAFPRPICDDRLRGPPGRGHRRLARGHRARRPSRPLRGSPAATQRLRRALGARTRMRWQRLRIVAGRREGWWRPGSAACAAAAPRESSARHWLQSDSAYRRATGCRPCSRPDGW